MLEIEAKEKQIALSDLNKSLILESKKLDELKLKLESIKEILEKKNKIEKKQAILKELETLFKGNRFVDGGLGGALKSQGNTPITPLVEAGCTHIIVSHLDHGSLWHRYDYPNVNIVEIRPSSGIDLSFAKLLDFSEENVGKLKTQGYLDTKKELGKILSTLSNFNDLDQKRTLLKDSLISLKASESSLENVMKRL